MPLNTLRDCLDRLLELQRFAESELILGLPRMNPARGMRLCSKIVDRWKRYVGSQVIKTLAVISGILRIGVDVRGDPYWLVGSSDSRSGRVVVVVSTRGGGFRS